jgi:hypothetical protein
MALDAWVLENCNLIFFGQSSPCCAMAKVFVCVDRTRWASYSKKQRSPPHQVQEGSEPMQDSNQHKFQNSKDRHFEAKQ